MCISMFPCHVRGSSRHEEYPPTLSVLFVGQKIKSCACKGTQGLDHSKHGDPFSGPGSDKRMTCRAEARAEVDGVQNTRSHTSHMWLCHTSAVQRGFEDPACCMESMRKFRTDTFIQEFEF